jgi:hypothetical protein
MNRRRLVVPTVEGWLLLIVSFGFAIALAKCFPVRPGDRMPIHGVHDALTAWETNLIVTPVVILALGYCLIRSVLYGRALRSGLAIRQRVTVSGSDIAWLAPVEFRRWEGIVPVILGAETAPRVTAVRVTVEMVDREEGVKGLAVPILRPKEAHDWRHLDNLPVISLGASGSWRVGVRAELPTRCASELTVILRPVVVGRQLIARRRAVVVC